MSRDQEVIKGQIDVGEQHTVLCKEIDQNFTQEYEGQCPCNFGTSFKCPAVNRYVCISKQFSIPLSQHKPVLCYNKNETKPLSVYPLAPSLCSTIP